MLPGQLFFQENAAPYNRGHAVCGNDRCRNSCMCCIRQCKNVSKLTGGFADRTKIFRAFLAKSEFLLLDHSYIYDTADCCK